LMEIWQFCLEKMNLRALTRFIRAVALLIVAFP
jgi:hypothetical protein